MIITHTKGRSLGGLGMYLLHDKREPGEEHRDTAERVMWTHTRNLLEDDPAEAVHEMIATHQAQPMLRRMSGQAKVGRPTKDSAYHVCLSWEPSERPDKAHMIEAAESYLRHMGHDEFQCLMVAHEPDANGRLHLHLEICRIHPETGQTINDKNDWRRAQAWAKQYQDERGQDFTPERTKRAEGQPYRNLHMPRWQYDEWKKTDLTREAFLDAAEQRDAQAQRQHADLKPRQAEERKQFFRDTHAQKKGLRAEVWTAVQRETAPRWQAYRRQAERAELERRGYQHSLKLKLRLAGYRDWATQLRRAGRQHAADLKTELKELRTTIQASQSARFEQVNAAAWAGFTQTRDAAYQDLLARHREERRAAREGQAAPVSSAGRFTAADMAAARASAVDVAIATTPHVAPEAKQRLNATAEPPQPVAPKQGLTAMLDAQAQRRKWPTAQAEPPRVIIPPPPPMPNERPAREKNQRDHEQQTRATEATQTEKGERLHPKAWERADWPREQAAKRDQQRAREDASQPYKPPSARTPPEKPAATVAVERPPVHEQPAPQVPPAPLSTAKHRDQATPVGAAPVQPAATSSRAAATQGTEPRAAPEAGKETTDQAAAQRSRPPETTDRQLAAAAKEARLQAIYGHAADRAERDRERGRER